MGNTRTVPLAHVGIVVPGLRTIEWTLPDPKGQPLQAVRAIRDEIRDRVKELIRGDCSECRKAAC